MPLATRPSVHDNRLISYTVDGPGRRVVLRTEFTDCPPHERTDVVFDGVIAYHFEGDTLDSILFDVYEVPAEQVCDDHADLFRRLADYAWPAGLRGDASSLADALKSRGIKGFVVSSSYGMSGFVLAAAVRFAALDTAADNP